MSDLDTLQLLLASDHAAAYGYGVLGARLDGAERTGAVQAEDTHLARRDAVQRLIRDRGATPDPAAAAYLVPAIADRTAALSLAIRLEEGVAASYRYGLGTTSAPEIRRLAVVALQDAAVRAVRFRLLLTPTGAANVAFPGLPSTG